MNLKIADLMAKRVITVEPHHTVGHARDVMERNRIHALPVVGPEMNLLGIVSSADLARKVKDASPVSRLMTAEVKTIPAYNDVSAAARAMRRAKVHHLVVTHEKKVAGLISSFDLLKLVEGHRFTMKIGPQSANKNKK